MYSISHLTDGDKTTVLDNDAEFVHFMRKIAVENEDEDIAITCLGEAMDYLENFCPNLKLN
jgi:hypothetical protein